LLMASRVSAPFRLESLGNHWLITNFKLAS
jgi:hypothetical protein